MLDPTELSDSVGAEAARRLRSFLRAVGLPTSQLAARESASAAVLARRVTSRADKLTENPRAPSEEDVRRIYEKVLC